MRMAKPLKASRRRVGSDELLARAGRAFLDHGPEMSTASLCGALGISKGGLYHHYSSKRDLLLRALEAANVSRDVEIAALARLLPSSRRDPEVAALLGRGETCSDYVLEEATRFGQKVAGMLEDQTPRLVSRVSR